MIINDRDGQNEDILSEEGSTQGDVPAMAMYAIGTKPLLDKLMHAVDTQQCKQVWYADDSSSGGKIREMRKWWDELTSSGPKYGYFPKPCKTIMIVKNEALLQEANQVFGNTEIKIGVEGERHLRAVIGSLDCKEDYVRKKIDNMT